VSEMEKGKQGLKGSLTYNASENLEGCEEEE